MQITRAVPVVAAALALAATVDVGTAHACTLQEGASADIQTDSYRDARQPLSFSLGYDTIAVPLPATFWIALADGDGNVGPAIEIAPVLPFAERIKFQTWLIAR